MSKRGETRLAVFEYIYKRMMSGDSAPTVRDICAALKLKSTSTAHLHLENLRSDGYIAFDDNLQRTIRLTGKLPEGFKQKPSYKQSGAASTVKVPLVGKVAAGLPHYAFEDMQAAYSLPREFLRGAEPEETYLLTVDGESMVDAGILTGDRIIVTRSFDNQDGDIVVARVSGDTATVKRIYHEGAKKIRLQPENSHMEPIIVASSEVEVIGRVIGLIRSY